MSKYETIAVNLPKEDIKPLTEMAHHLGISLPLAIAMSMQAALNRGYFKIDPEILKAAQQKTNENK